MQYREYTCVKRYDQDYYNCYIGINFLSEATYYQHYNIIKVPFVELSGIEGLYYVSQYFDKDYIKKKLNGEKVKFRF